MTHGPGHAVANHAAKRADKGVREEDRQNQRTDRYDHQIEIVRHDAFQPRFDKAERQSRQQGRDNLRLVADFLNREQTKVPDFRHLLAQQVGVHQLRRDQRDAQHDAEDRRAAHFLDRGPADAHRQVEEDRLANQPQEVINSFQRRVHLRQRLAVAHR